MSRRNARKHIFFLVYQHPFHKNLDIEEAMTIYFAHRPDFKEFDEADLEDITDSEKEFIKTEYRQTVSFINEIDQKISSVSQNWRLDRINKIDLAILRLAIFEIDFVPDIPVSVSINEAVDLARIYGAESSFSFVNGILGKIATLSEADNA